MTVDCERETKPKVVSGPAAAEPSLTTPAGLEAIAVLARRRLIFAVLNIATWSLVMLWAASIAGSGGWSWLDVVMLTALAIAMPWQILGFWNALIGLWQMRAGKPAVLVPEITGDRPARVTVKTAVLMTLRNEDPDRALSRLKIIKDSLDRTGEGAQFAYFVLSDTDQPAIAAREQAVVARWQQDTAHPERIVYRRREAPVGFKAGNVRDFAQGQGCAFELMLPLDADSLMTGPAIVALVGIMQRHPAIGILQSLVTGSPSGSAFTRLFQFGMRLGMRSYTIGQSWWVGDCGPFWGHNALVRIAPFVAHCALPMLPGKPPLGGAILSHDQVEAVLMRRAGYEVRVLPVEIGSFEDNPPDAMSFAERDTRWCQGNLQYLRLFGLAGLLPVSRYQLIWAVLMFIGVPGSMLLLAALPFAAADANRIADFPFASLAAFSAAMLAMHLAPKLAGIAGVLLTRGEAGRFGGTARFLLGAALEIPFSLVLAAITAFRTTLFIAGLAFGKSGGWKTQARDVNAVSWWAATAAFWPHMVAGLVLVGVSAALVPSFAVWGLPLALPLLGAIPFAVLTARPSVGRFFEVNGIGGIPEDFSPPQEMRALHVSGRR